MRDPVAMSGRYERLGKVMVLNAAGLVCGHKKTTRRWFFMVTAVGGLIVLNRY
jgi:hypothetical protein